jgi:SAM-dependent methyltransferase
VSAPVDWDAVAADQIAYYRARAPEYDESWTREGDYDHGPAFNERWWAEARRLDDALERFAPFGEILELAAGTGIWTERLARGAAALTAVDASPEVLAINRARLEGAPVPVEYVAADLFTWRPSRRYDVVAFTFWLTHVPPPRFEAFWNLVAAALRPDGRFFFVDSATPTPELPVIGRRLRFEGSTVEGIHSRTDLERGISVRHVRSGREFQTVKVYWEPAALAARLADLGWDADVRATDWAFIVGSGRRRRAER